MSSVQNKCKHAYCVLNHITKAHNSHLIMTVELHFGSQVLESTQLLQKKVTSETDNAAPPDDIGPDATIAKDTLKAEDDGVDDASLLAKFMGDAASDEKPSPKKKKAKKRKAKRDNADSSLEADSDAKDGETVASLLNLDSSPKEGAVEEVSEDTAGSSTGRASKAIPEPATLKTAPSMIMPM